MAKLCVPLTEITPDEMLRAMHRLPGYVHIAEIRLDYLWKTRPKSLALDLENICRRKDRPIILTVRPQREGGAYAGDEAERLELLRSAASLGADFIDVELDSIAALGDVSGQTRRIVSYHNFRETPPDLEGIFRRLQASGADVVKIAVRARDIVDTLPVLKLLERHARTVPTIALSMGAEGIPTRILAAKFGAFLSFASFREERASAEGQVPFGEMEQMYRFSRISRSTAVYGVVANPVAHSMSPAIHNAAFAELNMDAVYLPFKVAQPAPFLDGYQPYDLKGLSVTIPHKEAVLRLMDEVDELARRVGAVNTVAIREGRRYGSNTDVAAALAALEGAVRRAGGQSLGGCTALLLGAGGASRAIAFGLIGRVRKLIIANRTLSRAQELAAAAGAEVCPFEETGSLSPDIIINTTSVGMYPKVEESPVPPSMLRAGMVVFDAVYNPIHTLLLRQAEEAGCTTASGFEWFVSQAAAQFETWTGLPAPRKRMAEVVRARLAPSRTADRE